MQQFSALQIVLAFVAFAAICIFLQSARRWQLTDSALSLAIGACCLALLYATIAIQAYSGSDIKIAHIKASQLANSSVPALSVELTLYAPDGQASSDNTYLVSGNEWMLQGDIVKVSGVLAFAGLHSGYKLTRLEGRFDDPSLERSAKHTVVAINGGDDGFFQASHFFNSLLAPFIDASYGSAVMEGAGSFDIYTSQTGLWAKGV